VQEVSRFVRKCALCTHLICINACIHLFVCERLRERLFLWVPARARRRAVTVWQHKRSTRAGSGCSPKALLSLTLSTRSFSITGACCESCGRPNYLSPRDRLYTRFRWAGARRRDSHVAASHSFIRVRRRRPSLDQLFMISELIWRDESSRAESAIAIAARNKYGGRSLIFGWLCWFCSPWNATSWKMRRLYCIKL
jgi:hypothetical protein